MGADYIGLGLTTKQTDATEEEIEAALEKFGDDLIAAWDTIDEDERVWVHVEDVDDDDLEDAKRTALFDMIREAAAWVRHGRGYNAYRIDSDRWFVTAGGMSWGDSPFEQWDAVLVYTAAAEAVPAFGDAVGVYGGGIVLP